MITKKRTFPIVIAVLSVFTMTLLMSTPVYAAVNLCADVPDQTLHLQSTAYSYDSDVTFKCIWASDQPKPEPAVNPLMLKGRTATVRYSKLKKRNHTLAVTKVIRFTKKGQGKMTYTLSSAKKGSKSFKKYFKINKTTGSVTIRKNSKMKKGTYKVTVKVRAAGNANYKPSATKTVTFRIRVK